MIKYLCGIFPLLLLLAVILAWQCGTDKESLIQGEVDARTEAFINREVAVCRAQLLEEAGRMADSVLLAQAQAELRDSLQSRPSRPLPPIPLEALDSLPVQPLYKQEK